MKKILLISIMALVALAVGAQTTVKAPLQGKQELTTKQRTLSSRLKSAKKVQAKAPRRAASLVEIPSGIEPTEYTLNASHAVYGSTGWSRSSREETVGVVINGSDVYIQGLAYYFTEAWVKGTLNENTVTVESGQLVGEDEYGPEYLVGFYEVDEETDEISDYVFDFDAASGELTLQEKFYVGESAEAEELDLYAYLLSATLTPGALELPDVVELPDGAETETWFLTAETYDDEVENLEVGVAIVGNEIYIQGFASPYLPDAWVKGTLDGTTATFEAGQYYGNFSGYNLFFGAYGDDGMVDVTFEVDTDAGLITSEDYILIAIGAAGESFADYYAAPVISREPQEVREPLTPPENLVTDTYRFTGTDTYFETTDERDVQVGIVGDQVWIQGLSAVLPEAWAVGTLTGVTVTFPETYLGVYESFFGNFKITLPETTFNFDLRKMTFSTDEYATSSSDGFNMDEYADVSIVKIVEKAGTPAMPEVTGVDLDSEYPNVKFNIPLTDSEGNPMLSSKVTYKIYVEDQDGNVSVLTLTADLYESIEEDLTEIPYTFTDNYDIATGGSTVYLNQDEETLASWKRIGIQSIYYGADETHASEIAWYDVNTTGIDAVMDSTAEGQAKFFDLSGRAINGQTKGIVIKQTRTADGQTKAVKVVRR